MNKTINELIPKAIEALSNAKSEIANTNGEVEKEYKGYISSMGASILQSGLIATLAFYSKEVKDSGADRRRLLDAIFRLIEPTDARRENKTLLKYIIEKTRDTNTGNTIARSNLNQTKLKKYEQKISNALVALKLALRTYEQKK